MTSKVIRAFVLLILGCGTTFIVSTSFAQELEKLEKIEVVGSSLKRIEGETSLPVSIIKGDDLRKAGVTTVEEAVNQISANQTLLGLSQSIGPFLGGRSEANLRGLGANKTLVLLNGRRIANHAYSSGTTDLKAIPFAAIDRIEVLRDGASAIYGTDAIGGVINVITRKDVHGVEMSAEGERPESPGGKERRATFTGGIGSLDKDRFNFLAVIDYHKQEAVRSVDRDFAASGVHPERGLVKTSGIAYPANIFQSSTGVSGNPFFPGCQPPASFSDVNNFGPLCRFDFTRFIDLIPQNEQKSFLGKGVFQINENHKASLEYLWTENKVTARTAPATMDGLTMTPASPYYPGNGITPAVTGLDPTQNISVRWRSVEAGQRTYEALSDNQRVVGELDGTVGNWDYRTGLFWSQNVVKDKTTNGFLDYASISDAVQNGSPIFLNPFDTLTPDQLAFVNSSKILGQVTHALGEVTGMDARMTREIEGITAGPISFALGMETRHEKYQQIFDNTNFGTSVEGSRSVSALLGEVNIPLIVKTLEAQFAVRYDRYSDLGGTINPKVALRYQPVKSFLLRTSANTGFRAPTLYEINKPTQSSVTSSPFNDPLLCPNGNVAPGGSLARDCRQQLGTRLGGSQSLEPEKSRTYSFGAVFEPVSSLTASLDYWNIVLKNQIGTLGEQAAFADPAKYAAKFVRCGQIDPALARTPALGQCIDSNGNIDPLVLAYVDLPNENLGEVRTKGLDLSLLYRFPATSWGRFLIRYDGTYVQSYKFQREKDGVFIENVGRVVDAVPVFRWQHTFSVNWALDAWSTVLTNHFKSGYEDQNDPNVITNASFNNHVKQYSLWDVAVTWNGIKSLQLTAGVKNIFDTNPPFSNQGSTFQTNYDPRVTNPLGRTFVLRGTYSFK